jgi:hypothetical protein
LALKEVGAELLAVKFLQPRFVVKQFELRRRAALEKIDDAFRLGREMGDSRQASEAVRRAVLLIAPNGFPQQRRQRDRSDSGADALQQMTSCEIRWVGRWLVHGVSLTLGNRFVQP